MSLATRTCSASTISARQTRLYYEKYENPQTPPINGGFWSTSWLAASVCAIIVLLLVLAGGIYIMVVVLLIVLYSACKAVQRTLFSDVIVDTRKYLVHHHRVDATAVSAVVLRLSCTKRRWPSSAVWIACRRPSSRLSPPWIGMHDELCPRVLLLAAQKVFAELL